MLTKHFKILIFLLILFYQSSLYSKNTDNNDFNSKDLFNYFSALISYDNQKNTEALKFFNSSKYLINRHEPYLKKYITSLVIEGKVNRAIQELKYFIDKKNADFFEAYLLLALDSIVKKDFKKSTKYLSKLSNFKNNSVMELIIYQSLKDYIFLFKNKEISPHKNSYRNLSSISKTFQNFKKSIFGMIKSLILSNPLQFKLHNAEFMGLTRSYLTMKSTRRMSIDID